MFPYYLLWPNMFSHFYIFLQATIGAAPWF